MDSWLIPAAPVSVVEEIKKSRFITLLAHTDGVEAAKAFVVSVKTEHPDARHHCVAWVAGAACLAVAWRGLGTRVGMLAAFRLSAALLSLLAIQMMLGALAEYLALAAPTSAWARHLEALAAPVLPQGRWFGAFCAVLMVPPVAYILRCWWRESAPRV